MSRLRCINLFQGELSHLQPGSAPVSYPEPEPAAVPACESLQEHGPGYDSEPGTHWWGEFTDYKHSMKAACIFALQQIEIYPCWCMASATMACATKPHAHANCTLSCTCIQVENHLCLFAWMYMWGLFFVLTWMAVKSTVKMFEVFWCGITIMCPLVNLFSCLFAWNLILEMFKTWHTCTTWLRQLYWKTKALFFEQLGRHSWKVFLRKRFNRATEAVSVHLHAGLAVIISAFGMTSFDAWTKGPPPPRPNQSHPPASTLSPVAAWLLIS